MVRDLLSKYVIRTEDEEDDLEVVELFEVSAVLYRAEGPAPETSTMEECAMVDDSAPKIGKVRLLFGESVLSRRLKHWGVRSKEGTHMPRTRRRL